VDPHRRGFDGVIDFDRAVRDPAQPLSMLPAYDSGDHLHPNDLGMQAMADAIALRLFRGGHRDAPLVAAR
jgi:lysophospholipase L1-like esterase